MIPNIQKHIWYATWVIELLKPPNSMKRSWRGHGKIIIHHLSPFFFRHVMFYSNLWMKIKRILWLLIVMQVKEELVHVFHVWWYIAVFLKVLLMRWRIMAGKDSHLAEVSHNPVSKDIFNTFSKYSKEKFKVLVSKD